MPSRSTMLTGQHPRTHGVWMNGVALPVDAPSVAAELQRAGYRTALVGKPHFEPFLDPFGRFTENRIAAAGVPTLDSRWADGTVGPHRGFEPLELATPSPIGAPPSPRCLPTDRASCRARVCQYVFNPRA